MTIKFPKIAACGLNNLHDLSSSEIDGVFPLFCHQSISHCYESRNRPIHQLSKKKHKHLRKPQVPDTENRFVDPSAPSV